MNLWCATLWQRVLALTLILFLSTASLAQNSPSASMRVVLKGYDSVAYFTEKRPVKGAENISYDWDGERYLFSSTTNRNLFASNPDRYAPQYAGFCTNGMSKGKKNEADPELWKIVDGKLHVFASLRAKDTAEKDLAGTIVRASKNWTEIKRSKQ